MATAAGTMVMTKPVPGQRKQGSGKTSEFEEVYRTYFRSIYSFVAYRIGDRQAAEDVTSQVFEKALGAYGNYESGRAAISTWLFTIARNTVSDHFRRLGKQSHAELNERTAASQMGNPEAELEMDERQRQLARALSSLEAREQELVALKFGAALTNREIAELMSISESNAGTILYRSLSKLKSKLEGGIDND